jgi:hypothetical protein
MKNVMIDLETLGTRAGCKVLSIGAVEFTENHLGHSFYQEAERGSQFGLHESSETLKWWSEQNQQAKQHLFVEQGKSKLSEVLGAFTNWLKSVGGVDQDGLAKVCVWGNGADFDNAVLITAYAVIRGEQAPWHHHNNRCYRTLKNLNLKVSIVRQGVHHNALDDAKSQAEHAIRLQQEFLNARKVGKAD